MSDQLTIHTFGGLSVQLDGEPVLSRLRKALALLVYLASNPRPHPREVLAEMLWEDRTQAQSLANLRVVLTDLRHAVGSHVCVTREAVGVNLERNVWLDVDEFEAIRAEPGSDPTQLEDALTLYRGDFLDGFYIDSQGFEDWTLLERERLRFRAMDALDALIAFHLGSGDYASGIARTTQLLRMDTLREKTYRHLMLLLALSDEREAALAQYEACCRMLREELGVTPTPETVQLYDRICAGKLVASPQHMPQTVVAEPVSYIPARPRHNLPVQATSFIGREDDIAAILDRLTEPSCRLLTLVGSGGMGKTRLALAVADRLVDTFKHGVFFVALAPVQSAEDITTAITTVFPGQSFGGSGPHMVQQGRESLEDQLFNYLGEKQMLLVLDNCEHLLDGMGLVDSLLSRAPGVKVLATSREPLHLGWEWLSEVRGLRFPRNTEPELAEDFSAIRLFVERARRVQPTFRLADQHANVIRICQLVEGMPLGIEIAAAWLRAMPCEEIALALLDLETPQRDAPQHHRSLRALFDQTWQRLPPQEQAALMTFSVFRGGFTRDAAEAVAQTSPARLATLVNRSLLQRDPDTGRYTMHELLRQYADEQLDSVPEARALLLERYVTFYVTFLCEQAPSILRGHYRAVRSEQENLQQTWDLVTSHSRLLAAHGVALRVWFIYWLNYYNDPWAVECHQDDLERAAALLRTLPSSINRDIVLGQVLVMQALALKTARGFQETRIQPLLDDSLALLRASGALEELAFALYIAGAWGITGARLAYLKESLALWQQLGNTLEMARCLELMGATCNYFLLDMPRAKPLIEQALVLYKQARSPQGEWMCLINLGVFAITEGYPSAAKRLYEEALHIALAMENENRIGDILNNLAYCALDLGDYAAAEQYAQRAFDIKCESGSVRLIIVGFDTRGDVSYRCGNCAEARTLYGECLGRVLDHRLPEEEKAVPFSKLGFTAVALGDVTEAQSCFRAALELAAAAELTWVVLDTLLGTALLYHNLEKHERALDLFGVAAACSFHDKHVQDEARLRAELEAEFGPVAVAAAVERGKQRDLLEVVSEVLAELDQNT